MQWENINSVAELKALGKLRDVSAAIQSQCPEQQVPKGSWDKLLQFVIANRQQDKSIEKRWDTVTSIEELRELGAFKTVRDQVLEEIGQIKLVRQSWDALWKVIKDREEQSTEPSQVSMYFKGKDSEIIFYLLELEGEVRLKKLSVTNRHYKDKDWASNWKKQMIKLIHPDQSAHPMAEVATKELNKLYEGMIKFGK